MLGDAKLVGERWALQRHIGSGSFAVVWKAQHVATGKTVAIKEIKEITNKKLMQARCLRSLGTHLHTPTVHMGAVLTGERASVCRAWRGRSPS